MPLREQRSYSNWSNDVNDYAKSIANRERTVAKKAKTLVKGKTTEVGVCATWLIAFGSKKLKTKADVTKFMKKEFLNRDSVMFNYPNAVVGRANRVRAHRVVVGKKPAK